MRQIIEIAFKELKLLFYSPIGWLTLMVFSIHTTLILFGRIDSFLFVFESNGIDVDYFTRRFFTGYNALFPTISSAMYLYIPLITMGILSKEYSQGSIKLLFSSPIKTHEIVYGKFLSMMVYSLSMLLILLALVLITRISVLDTIDFSVLLIWHLRIYLLICLYTAIGLFISSLTSFQLISAVGTFATLFILNSYLSIIVQDAHPVLLQNLLGSWLPPRFRLENYNGLQNVSDLYYFIILTTLFIVLTYLKLHFLRGSRSKIFKTSIISIVLVAFLGLGVYTNNPDKFIYVDMTDKKLNSPSHKQNEILTKYNQPIHLLRYYNVLERPLQQSMKGFLGISSQMDRLTAALKIKPTIEYKPYIAHTENMHIAFVELDTTYSDATQLATQRHSQLNRTSFAYDLDRLETVAKERFAWLNHDDILTKQEVIDEVDLFELSNKDVYYLVSETDTVVMNIGTLFPSDIELTASIKSILNCKSNIGVVVSNSAIGFTESIERSYQLMFNDPIRQFSLINQGFDLKKVELLSDLSDIDILVLADPKQDFSEREMENFLNYIENGGNAFIAASINSSNNLNNLLSQFGVQIKDSMQESKYSTISNEAIIGYDTLGNGFLENQIITSSYRFYRLFSQDGESYEIHSPNALGLEISPINSSFTTYPIIFNDIDTTMIGLVRTINAKEQRIIVSGSDFIISNQAEGVRGFSPYGNVSVNFVLGVSIFRWLSNDLYPVLIDREPQIERFKLKHIGVYKVLVMATMSLPLIIMSIVVLYKRKRK